MAFRNRQQLVIALIALVMGAGFIFGRYLPVRSRAAAVEQARRDQNLAITQGAADTHQLPLLEERLDATRALIDTYERGITTERELGSFLSRIADLMSRHNLEEQLVAPVDQIEAEKLTCIPINMQCTGRFSDVFEFYKDLAGLDRFIRIEQIKLTNNEKLSGAVTMKTRAVIFYRVQPGSTTK